jgi:putative ABC transport system permease protein
MLLVRVLAAMPRAVPAGADRIERLLSLGASRAEATRDLLGRAVRLAMTPLLNQMSVVGLVSIPGMMTGQILGGSHPDQAARCGRAFGYFAPKRSATACTA